MPFNEEITNKLVEIDETIEKLRKLDPKTEEENAQIKSLLEGLKKAKEKLLDDSFIKAYEKYEKEEINNLKEKSIDPPKEDFLQVNSELDESTIPDLAQQKINNFNEEKPYKVKKITGDGFSVTKEVIEDAILVLKRYQEEIRNILAADSFKR